VIVLWCYRDGGFLPAACRRLTANRPSRGGDAGRLGVAVEFRLLGRFEIEHAGRLIAVGRRAQRCLLGVLLLEANAAVPVERLIELLWDSDPPAGARGAIHVYVSRLRASVALGGEGAGGLRLVRSGDGYLAQVDPQAVDALRFRALVEQARGVREPAERARVLRGALRLWRGRPLEDVASERLQERLAGPWQEVRLGAIEAAIEAEMACGRHAEAVGELSALVVEHPYRERLSVLRMLALYHAGRQAEALSAYQDVRRVLVDQLGVEPGPELRELHQHILAGDTKLLLPSRGDPAPAATRASAAGTVPRQLPAAVRWFVGRQAELGTLTGLLEQITATGGTVVISAIDGMAGIGKTALQYFRECI
jgi:DNA-binding SARP family transcriptional activator